MKKLISLTLCLILSLAVFAGCTNGSGNTDTSGSASGTSSDTVKTDDYRLKVGTLKGPTGMGMAKLIKDGADKYDISISSDPEKLSPELIKGNLDIASVPVNLAAVINQKTNGKYQIAAVNTLGVLYLLENGNSIKTIADLAGKTVYATGKGATPEYILNHILTKNGLDTVKVEYKSEHSELAALMVKGDVVIGMLPEPNVTTVMSKNSNVRIALNLTEEWKRVSEGEAVQGCVIVSKDAIANHGELVNTFLSEYKASCEYVTANVKDAAALIAELKIVPSADIAEKAIPNCNIVYIEGEQMVSILNPFYKVLFDADPLSVGGKIPDESAYYKK